MVIKLVLTDLGFNPRFGGEAGRTNKEKKFNNPSDYSFNPRFGGEAGRTVALSGTVIIISFGG